MPRDGKPTRDKILAESRSLIYEYGFAGTSIDLILERTGITKGAFFYHFKTKADLAKVMINEFAEADLKEMDEVMTATKQYDSPKERLLNFVQFFIDKFANVKEPPSCLYASISNEKNQYNEEIQQVVRDTMLRWREALENLIDEVVASNTAKIKIDKTALADHFNVVTEGAFVISKSLNDPSITAKQLIHLKQYLDLLFE